MRQLVLVGEWGDLVMRRVQQDALVVLNGLQQKPVGGVR